MLGITDLAPVAITRESYSNIIGVLELFLELELSVLLLLLLSVLLSASAYTCLLSISTLKA
jgi:hypothetical protein